MAGLRGGILDGAEHGTEVGCEDILATVRAVSLRSHSRVVGLGGMPGVDHVTWAQTRGLEALVPQK